MHINMQISVQKSQKKQINPFLFSGSLALHLDEFTVGGDAELEFKERKDGEEFLRDYNFGGSYKNDNLQIVSTVVEKLSKANLGIVHKIKTKIQLLVLNLHINYPKMQNHLMFKLEFLIN